MAVYYKFKSAKDYDSVPMDGHFISVGQLKEKIFELKHLGGTDFDLIVTNAQTNEEYLDEGMLIPKNTSVLIRRVPGRPRKPIVTAPVSEQEELIVDHNSEDAQAIKGSFAVADQSYGKYADDLEWDEFGNDLYAMPETTPVPSSIPVQDATPVSKEDEESKIKALIDTPALDWQRQPSDGFNPGRGFMRGGRMQGGRGGFAARGGFEKKTPPQGYICHRCKVSGHFIQHCPTNGDPNFDIRRVKPPTGIPKSMLIATPDGSYALASGAPASLKPNEAAFEKEIEGMPSTRSIGELPRELRCPLCQEVMKDAVLASKCCLKSFCDKCIRDHIISKSMCECGATSILADDLLPNKTVRDTINRILESSNNSAENGGSAFQAQDMESRIPQAKVTSPTQSAASKGQQQVHASPLRQQEIPKIVETIEENKPADVPLKSEKGLALKVPDASEATHDSRMVKEAASQGSAPLADEEVQQKPMSGEAGRKKKKKKIRMAPNPAEMQWRTGPDLAPENYMMNNPGWNNQGPSAFNPGWNGMQPGFDGFMPYGAGHMPYGGYGVNPMDVQFGGFLPYGVSHMDVPFAGPPPGGILSYGPQRDLSELVGYNAPPPIMSREEFEARKADLKRKREMERRDDSCRELPKDREYGREGSSTVNVSSRSKSRLTPPPSGADHHLPSRHHHTPERRSRDPELPRPSSKKKPDFDHEDHHLRRREYHEETHRDHHHRSSSSSHHRRSESPTEPPPASSQACSAAEKKHKASVFSRISFPAGGESSTKKRKVSSSDAPVAGSTSHRASNGQHEEHKATSGSRKGASAATVGVTIDQDSSDDERHFKRRPSRYTSSPPAAAPAEEENRHSRGSKDRERERYSSKRR